jgi:hypothetical protein
MANYILRQTTTEAISQQRPALSGASAVLTFFSQCPKFAWDLQNLRPLVNNLTPKELECRMHDVLCCLGNVASDKRISILNDMGTALHFSTAFSRVLSGMTVFSTTAVKLHLVLRHSSSWRNSINKIPNVITEITNFCKLYWQWKLVIVNVLCKIWN